MQLSPISVVSPVMDPSQDQRSTTDPNKPARSFFQCGSCSQSYTRLDHLARHVRSHTQEKPYECETCGKRFGRIDLLRRHAAGHEANPENSNKRRKTGASLAAAVRVSQACDSCAENHLKCEDQKPCKRCQKKKIPCRVAQKTPEMNFPIPMHTPSEASIERGRDVQPNILPFGGKVPHMPHFENQIVTPPLSESVIHPAESVRQQFSYVPNGVPPPMHPEDVAQNASIQYTPDMIHPSMDDSVEMFSWPPVAFSTGFDTPRQLMGLRVHTDLDFSEFDMRLLESYNSKAPFSFEDYEEAGQHQYTHPDHNSNTTVLPIATDMLKKSTWHFVPNSSNHSGAEVANLSLSTEAQERHKTRISVDRRTTEEKLDLAARDKIFSIVLSTCKPPLSRALSSFPSVELLDSLIQFYLTSPISNASKWFHIPSHTPKKTRVELLLSMASAGAVLAPDPALRKLGSALQEVVRRYSATVWEDDNTEVRNIVLIQGYVIQLGLQFWSGDSRKMEIGESFLQPPLTMLRRGNRFKRSNYRPIIVRPEDKGETLHKLWLQWIEQESAKRLVLLMLEHDMSTAITLLKPPLFSYAELTLPLPECEALWTSGSAGDWKRLYMHLHADPNSRIPSVVECINDLELLESYHSLIDFNVSCSAVLHALWGLVWEYRQRNALLKVQGAGHDWDGGVSMRSGYQELIKMLQTFRLGYPGQGTLLLECMLMHMHASVDEIQLFCGFDGHDEAKRVGMSIRDWAKSETARQAVWHAGQVVRAAKALPPHHLRDFDATAVFHASLVFWAYALASDRYDASAMLSGGLHGAQVTVCLDEEQTPELQRFISLARGAPGVRGMRYESEPTLLRDPAAIMDVVLGVMEANHRHAGLKPALVENSTLLMEGLRDVARRHAAAG